MELFKTLLILLSFWAAFALARDMFSVGLEEPDDLFWAARGKKAWPNSWQGRSSDLSQKRDENPFWAARGKKLSDDAPFWAARGKKDDDAPFWAARGKKDQADDAPFWAARGKRLLRDDDDDQETENGRGKRSVKGTGKNVYVQGMLGAALQNRPARLSSVTMEPFWAARGKKGFE